MASLIGLAAGVSSFGGAGAKASLYARLNAPRYADYAAFVDPVAGLVGVPDGAGGLRPGSLSDFFSVMTGVSIDNSTYDIPVLKVFGNTNRIAAYNLFAADEFTLVLGCMGVPGQQVLAQSNSVSSQYLSLTRIVSSTFYDNISMSNGTNLLSAGRRTGSFTSRFRTVSIKRPGGRAIAINGGAAASDTYTVNTSFPAGRLNDASFDFVGIIASDKGNTWATDNSLPEPTICWSGDSFVHAKPLATGPGGGGLTDLLPGYPPMLSNALGGDPIAAIVIKFTAENSGMACHRGVWGGHNGYDAATWEAAIDTMIAATPGGLSNFILLPVFPYDGAGGTNAIKAVQHAHFKSKYGVHYIGAALDDLVALGGPGQAYEDAYSFAQGIPPAGLREDGLHLNDAAYLIVSAIIRAAYPALGWRI